MEISKSMEDYPIELIEVMEPIVHEETRFLISSKKAPLPALEKLCINQIRTIRQIDISCIFWQNLYNLDFI